MVAFGFCCTLYAIIIKVVVALRGCAFSGTKRCQLAIHIYVYFLYIYNSIYTLHTHAFILLLFAHVVEHKIQFSTRRVFTGTGLNVVAPFGPSIFLRHGTTLQ